MGWISLQEAAGLAGMTIGELCQALSQSGCVDAPGLRVTDPRVRGALVKSPPSHPAVRARAWLDVDPRVLRDGRVFVLLARCGQLYVSHVREEDMVSWLADRAARLVRKCELCGGSRKLRIPVVDDGYRLCPKCSADFPPAFPGRTA